LQNRQTFSAPQNYFVKILQKAVLQEAKTQSQRFCHAFVKIKTASTYEIYFKAI
jgi:G:T/U-mismatch repair DNA glycosylase